MDIETVNQLVENTTQPQPETTAPTESLPHMETHLNHDPEKGLLEYFAKCYEKTFIQVDKDGEGNLVEMMKPDPTGFYESFKKIQALLAKGNPNSTETHIALEQVCTKLLRCLEELYFREPLRFQLLSSAVWWTCSP